jgi:PAS domain-containing protein
MWAIDNVEKLPLKFWAQLERTLLSSIHAIDIGWRFQTGPDLHLALHHVFGIQKVFLVDVFEPNLQTYAKHYRKECPWVELILADVRHIIKCPWQIGPAQLVIWQGGPEHLKKEEAGRVLGELQNIWDAILLEMPKGTYPQGPLFGNPAEEHLSEWEPEEMEKAGWMTADHPTYPDQHFLSFWRRG